MAARPGGSHLFRGVGPVADQPAAMVSRRCRSWPPARAASHRLSKRIKLSSFENYAQPLVSSGGVQTILKFDPGGDTLSLAR